MTAARPEDRLLDGPALLDLSAHAAEVLVLQRAALGTADQRGPDHYVRHAGRPGHRAFGWWRGGGLVAFTYGHACGPEDWWTQQIRGAVPPELLDGAYSVVELHVLPSAQRGGIGRTLLRLLLDGVPHPRALLSAYDEPTPARRLYRSEGFRDVVSGFVFPTGAQRYVIMAADLPLGGRPGAARS